MSEAITQQVRLLYFTAEQWPTFRPDVLALFGKYLPRNGVTSDLVTEIDHGVANAATTAWPGGRALLCQVPRNRAGQYFVKLWHNVRVLATLDAAKYDAIQVRDMSLTALIGLLVARVKGIAFYYWLSYPQSEGQIDRARSRGVRGGIRFWFPLVQGVFGKWLLYRIVLPRADHIFVQSAQMRLDVAQQGIPIDRMTPVPMGVDTEVAKPSDIKPATDPRLTGKRVLVYLGTLDPLRQIDVLLMMLVHVRKTVPNIVLVLVGDTTDASHRAWLKQEAQRLDVSELVVWTGWLDAVTAWSFARAAEVGLSPIPRGYLLDMGSPTKAIEYMALGLPVVVNDNPDQAQAIADSGGGLCVELTPEHFANAVTRLLGDSPLSLQMGDAGKLYVARARAYDSMARTLAEKYRALQIGRRR